MILLVVLFCWLFWNVVDIIVGDIVWKEFFYVWLGDLLDLEIELGWGVWFVLWLGFIIFFSFMEVGLLRCGDCVIVVDVSGSMLLVCNFLLWWLYVGFSVSWFIMGVNFLFLVICGLVMCSCVCLGFFFSGYSCGLRMFMFWGECGIFVVGLLCIFGIFL